MTDTQRNQILKRCHVRIGMKLLAEERVSESNLCGKCRKIDIFIQMMGKMEGRNADVRIVLCLADFATARL